MSADVNVLREYLVSLGIKIDDDGAKKLSKNLDGWDKQAKALSVSLIAVGGAAAAAVGVFAYQMEKLYFASKIAQSSAGNLQAISAGADRIGIGGDKMRQTVEGIARTIRGNPGVAGLVQSFGIRVQGRDMSDVAEDLMTALSKMPIPVANAYGRLFGIDEDTIYLWKTMRQEAQEAMQEQRRNAALMGINVDQAAKAGHEVANAWRDVKNMSTLFIEGLAVEALPLIEQMRGGMAEWLGQMIRGVQNIKLIFSEGDDYIAIQNDEVREMAGYLHAIVTEWRALNDLRGENPLVVDASKAPQTAAGTLSGKDWYEVTDPDGSKRVVKKRWLDKKFEQFMKWAGAKGYQDDPVDVEPPPGRPSSSGASNDPKFGTGTGSRGQRNNNPGNIEYNDWARQHGAVGSDGRFAVFPSMETGANAQNDLLQSYRARGLNTPRGIIGRWAPTAENGQAGTDAYLADIQKRTGIKPDDVITPEQMGLFQQAQAAHESGVRLGTDGQPLSAPGGAGGAAGITQTNHISVSGVSDPNKAADAVAEQQRVLDADLTRNNKTRVY